MRPPAVTELCEQLVRSAAVLGLLWLFLPQYPERAVGLVVAGMVICEVFSAVTLAVLYRRRRGVLSGPGEPGAVRRRRIAAIALPVGLNACWAICWGRPTPLSSPKSWWRGAWPGGCHRPAWGWCAA